MNTMNTTTTIETIIDAALEQFGSTETITAYQVAQIVNAGVAYLELDEDRAVAPQYVYNATKSIRKASADGRLSRSDARSVAIRILRNRVDGGKPKATNLLAAIKAQLDVVEETEQGEQA